jgi:hypothetical protein
VDSTPVLERRRDLLPPYRRMLPLAAAFFVVGLAGLVVALVSRPTVTAPVRAIRDRPPMFEIATIPPLPSPPIVEDSPPQVVVPFPSKEVRSKGSKPARGVATKAAGSRAKTSGPAKGAPARVRRAGAKVIAPSRGAAAPATRKRGQKLVDPFR